MFGKQIFLLVEVKTCGSDYTKLESQTSQKTEYIFIGENRKVIISFANENLYILDISQIQQAETCIFKLIQSKYYMKKLLIKKQGSEEVEIKKSSQIYNLDPYLDKDGIIRVGGRLDKSNLNNECKHLIMLPKGSPISKLIIT